MPRFYSYISNGKYSVGCTGQTVYIYNTNGIELAKFKDLPYAYLSVISPQGDICVVKTTDGRLAIYSLTELKLLKKFRYSKVDGGQDGNCCFSPSGKYFLNIEMHKTDLDTALSIYDTSDFSLIKRITQENNICLDLIEYDTQTDNYYMLGFERIRQGKEIVNVQNFVCLWENDKITNPQYITEKEYDFYWHYIRAKILGFTKQSVIEDEYDLDKLKSYNYSLAKLWHYYISKNQK